MKKKITIKMPKALLKKWTKALDSDEYIQCEKVLFDKNIGGFCCLGLLQYLASNGNVEVNSNGTYSDLPSTKWLDKNGIQFFDIDDILNNNPWLPSLKLDAANANDSGDYTFQDISKAIKKCAKGY